MTCDSCRHQDARTYGVPICRKAGKPQACVLAFERAVNAKGECRYFERKR